MDSVNMMPRISRYFSATRATMNLPVIGAYFSTLYYLEIIYLMVIVLFVFGKTVAVICGILMTLALTAHILRFFNRRRGSRMTQLIMMDVHASVAAAFVITMILRGSEFTPATGIILALRVVILTGEIPLIYLLSGKEGARLFPGTLDCGIDHGMSR